MNTIHNAGVVAAVVAALGMAGCDRTPPAPGAQRGVAPSSDLVEELASDPVKLKELRRLCREEREQVDEALCVASARAARQRFMRDGKTKYTLEPVELPDAQLPDPKRE